MVWVILIYIVIIQCNLSKPSFVPTFVFRDIWFVKVKLTKSCYIETLVDVQFK